MTPKNNNNKKIAVSEGRRTLAKTKRLGLTVLLMEAVEGEQGVPWDHLDVASTVQRFAGQAVEAYTEKSGSRYVFEVSDPADAIKLKQITQLTSGRMVRVIPHPVHNQVRCVVSNPDIYHVSEQILKEQFAAQGVVDVHRICKGNGTAKAKTSSVVLTFEGTSFPANVKFGLLRIQTRPYYSLPLQCYNCYGYGHGKTGCKNKTRCRVCSGVHDIATKCRAKAFCSNCRGNHQPMDRKCPTYVKEAAVLKLRTDNGVSYRDAKKAHNTESHGKKSYAQVAKETPAAAPLEQQVPSTSASQKKRASSTSASQRRRIKAKEAKAAKAAKAAAKPVPKTGGPGGVSTPKVANAGGKEVRHTRTIGVGTGPPASLAPMRNASGKTDGGKDAVPTRAVGTDPMPDTEISSPDTERQLRLEKVESLIREVTRLKEKYRNLKETLREKKSREEPEYLATPVEQPIEEIVSVVIGSSEDDVSAPLTRRKRKMIAEAETTKSVKSRKKGEPPRYSPPGTSILDRESDAATSIE